MARSGHAERATVVNTLGLSYPNFSSLPSYRAALPTSPLSSNLHGGSGFRVSGGRCTVPRSVRALATHFWNAVFIKSAVFRYWC